MEPGDCTPWMVRKLEKGQDQLDRRGIDERIPPLFTRRDAKPLELMDESADRFIAADENANRGPRAVARELRHALGCKRQKPRLIDLAIGTGGRCLQPGIPGMVAGSLVFREGL